MLKIASWNVRELRPYFGTDLSSRLVRIRKKLKLPDIMCLQGIGITAADQKQVETLRAAFPGFRCIFSLQRGPSIPNGKSVPSGVVSWYRENLHASTLKYDWDFEGRVAVVTIPSMNLAVFNVLAVQGHADPYWNPTKRIYESDRYAFQRGFIEHIGAEAVALGGCGLELALIGNWNLARTPLDIRSGVLPVETSIAREQFNNELVPSLSVEDPYRIAHPRARRYTHMCGTDEARVDCALVSASLASKVIAAEVQGRSESLQDGEHLPISVTIKHGGRYVT